MNSKKTIKQIYSYTVPEFYEGTVYDYLRKREGYSRGVITSVIQDGSLEKNGRKIPFKSPCRAFDTLTVTFPEEKYDCEAEDYPLKILYEDEYMLAADKPAGTLVHPTKGAREHTLANYVYGHYAKIGLRAKTRFVSRLDMNTTGIVLIAKSQLVHHLLQEAFSEEGSCEKTYMALVSGRPNPEAGTIDAPIALSSDGIRRTVSPEGRRSITEYRVVSTDGLRSLVEVKLRTGRTHQIRVHMKHIGCPLVGDALYNEAAFEGDVYFLRAVKLKFTHPISKESVEIRADLNLPEDRSLL